MNIACHIKDPKALQKIGIALRGAGMHCDPLICETSLTRLLSRGNYDLVVIEISDTPTKYESVFSWMACRSEDATPVIILSSTQNVDLAVMALGAGADDFALSSIDTVELVARVQSILRRAGKNNKRRFIKLGDFTIDSESRTMQYRGETIELTPREFTMAWMFFSTPGKFISRETLSGAIWGVDSNIANRTIEQHVYKLRKKLEFGPSRGLVLRTAYNQGYRLDLVDAVLSNVLKGYMGSSRPSTKLELMPMV